MSDLAGSQYVDNVQFDKVVLLHLIEGMGVGKYECAVFKYLPNDLLGFAGRQRLAKIIRVGPMRASLPHFDLISRREDSSTSEVQDALMSQRKGNLNGFF